MKLEGDKTILDKAMPRSFLVKKNQDELQQLTAKIASHVNERQMSSPAVAPGKNTHCFWRVFWLCCRFMESKFTARQNFFLFFNLHVSNDLCRRLIATTEAVWVYWSLLKPGHWNLARGAFHLLKYRLRLFHMVRAFDVSRACCCNVALYNIITVAITSANRIMQNTCGVFAACCHFNIHYKLLKGPNIGTCIETRRGITEAAIDMEWWKINFPRSTFPLNFILIFSKLFFLVSFVTYVQCRSWVAICFIITFILFIDASEFEPHAPCFWHCVLSIHRVSLNHCQ